VAAVVAQQVQAYWIGFRPPRRLARCVGPAGGGHITQRFATVGGACRLLRSPVCGIPTTRWNLPAPPEKLDNDGITVARMSMIFIVRYGRFAAFLDATGEPEALLSRLLQVRSAP